MKVSVSNIPLKEKLSFGAYLGGQNLFYNFIATYLMIFYTDALGMVPAAVGVMFFIARLWDAFNDPIMGIVVSKTNTPWGKYKPYLVVTPILIGLMTILCFAVPNLSDSGKLVYAYITYISWGMIFTINDVPIWSFSAVITSDTKERVGLIGLAQLFINSAFIIVLVGTIPLTMLFGGNDNMRRSYLAVAVLFSVFSASVMMFSVKNMKERVKATTRKVLGLKEMFRFLRVNKPLAVILIATVADVLGATLQGALLYFITYNLNKVELFPLIAGINVPFLFLGIIIISKLNKKYCKKKLYLLFCSIGMIAGVTFYFLGYSNLIVVIVMFCMQSFSLAYASVLVPAMYSDTIDYAEYKTGNRAEALVFSIKTLSIKIKSALSAMLIAFILTGIGYIANEAQSDLSLKGIFAMVTIIPSAGNLLKMIIMGSFYHLTDDKVKRINLELEKRRGEEQIQG